MTKVLLLNPNNSLPKDSDFIINIFQPLGLAYIAAMLKKHHYKVEIFDSLAMGFDHEVIDGKRKIIGLDYSEIIKKITKYKPTIVGIATPFSFQAEEAHKAAAIIKKINKKIIVIAGGAHATIQPEELLNDKNFDYLIRGEGEYNMLEFVKAVDHHRSVKKIPGLSFKDKTGQIVHNPKGLPILKLDELPFPSRELLPMSRYFDAAKKGRVVEGLLEYGQKRTSLFTSRGCPFNCTFCSVHLTSTRTWRSRSPENVVKEIKDCVKKYGIKYFDILDDNFTLDANRAKKICQLIIDNGLKIKWSTPNGIRADTVDEELVILMKKAGCIQVKVAPESGNLRVVTEIIRKHLDLDKVKNVVKLCKKHDLSIEAFFIIGFPEETEAEMFDTINFGKELRRLGCDYCYFFIATPYFGTEMFDDAVKKGYVDANAYSLNEVITTTSTSLIKSPNFTPERLLEIHKIANQVNPPLTKMRLVAGLKIAVVDPVRFIKFVISYFSYFLIPAFRGL